jgi:hypothetical protein
MRLERKFLGVHSPHHGLFASIKITLVIFSEKNETRLGILVGERAAK